MACGAWLAGLKQQVLLSDLPANRRWSYLLFSLALCVALGTTQFVGPVKTAVFFDLVGTEYEPLAKSLVLVVLLPLLVVYSILVSLLQSPRLLVAVVCACYMLLFLLITGVLIVARGKPGPWVAWVLYYAVETKTVILMPMIWSVVADVSTPDLSKKAYPFVFFVIQLGGVVGSIAAIKVGSLGGEVGLLTLQTVTFAAIGGLSWAAVGFSARAEEEPDELQALRPAFAPEKPAEGGWQGWASRGLARAGGGFEGAWLLVSRPYVLMAFWVSYASLMPRTIMDYQNGVLVKHAYPARQDQIAFFGHVNLLANCGIAVLALLGSGPIMAICGMRGALMVLPMTMALCLGALCNNYTLWSSVWALLLSSVVAFGLNSPCKEMLFVRTSRDIKYKAKGWSEMYGNQLMKLFGAQVNLWINREAAACRPHCFHVSSTMTVVLTWVAVWMAVAFRLGSMHRYLESKKTIVT